MEKIDLVKLVVFLLKRTGELLTLLTDSHGILTAKRRTSWNTVCAQTMMYLVHCSGLFTVESGLSTLLSHLKHTKWNKTKLRDGIRPHGTV